MGDRRLVGVDGTRSEAVKLRLGGCLGELAWLVWFRKRVDTSGTSGKYSISRLRSSTEAA